MRVLLALPLRNGRLNIMTSDDKINDLKWSKEVSQHLSDEKHRILAAKSIKIIKTQKRKY